MKSVLAAPILELSSTTAIKAAVAEGVGPAVLSSHLLVQPRRVRTAAPGRPTQFYSGAAHR